MADNNLNLVRVVTRENLDTGSFIFDEATKKIRVKFPERPEDKVGITNLVFDNDTKKVTWTDSTGTKQEYNFSAFLTDVKVNGGSLEGTVLTLTQEGGASVTVDLAELATPSVASTNSIKVAGTGSETDPLYAEVKYNTNDFEVTENGLSLKNTAGASYGTEIASRALVDNLDTMRFFTDVFDVPFGISFDPNKFMEKYTNYGSFVNARARLDDGSFNSTGLVMTTAMFGPGQQDGYTALYPIVKNRKVKPAVFVERSGENVKKAYTVELYKKVNDTETLVGTKTVSVKTDEDITTYARTPLAAYHPNYTGQAYFAEKVVFDEITVSGTPMAETFFAKIKEDGQSEYAVTQDKVFRDARGRWRMPQAFTIYPTDESIMVDAIGTYGDTAVSKNDFYITVHARSFGTTRGIMTMDRNAMSATSDADNFEFYWFDVDGNSWIRKNVYDYREQSSYVTSETNNTSTIRIYELVGNTPYSNGNKTLKLVVLNKTTNTSFVREFKFKIADAAVGFSAWTGGIGNTKDAYVDFIHAAGETQTEANTFTFEVLKFDFNNVSAGWTAYTGATVAFNNDSAHPATRITIPAADTENSFFKVKATSDRLTSEEAYNIMTPRKGTFESSVWAYKTKETLTIEYRSENRYEYALSDADNPNEMGGRGVRINVTDGIGGVAYEDQAPPVNIRPYFGYYYPYFKVNGVYSVV